jgi:Raf kinase inhibitor-like YbhB/YbcL family protein
MTRKEWLVNPTPSPYDFLPKVPSFSVTSKDIQDGNPLSLDQVLNGFGHSGKNYSPHLRWEGYPPETKSFAVTCFDPDAPTGSGFWHWVLFDLPANVNELPTGAGSGNKTGLPTGAVHARSDFGTTEYGGAAPPERSGTHRYMFAVHALGVEKLGLDSNATPALVGFYLTGNTVARGVIIPIYGG